MSLVRHDFNNARSVLSDSASANPAAGVSNAAYFDSRRSEDTLAARLLCGDALLSVVVPLLNEEESLDELYRRLKSAFACYAPRHEIIFVDDGSRDGSYRKLFGFWEADPNVTVLRFRRNFGKAAGLTAAFERVRGDVVIMMDADLQDQPEEFGKLIAKLDEGYDLVSGWKQRRHDPAHKTLPSKLFNRTVSRHYKLNIHDFNCGLKIMRGNVAQDIRIYGDWHRFIPVIAASKGYRVGECVIEHAPRVHGVSKYGAKRLITGLMDFLATILVVQFYHKPLQFFGPFGIIASLLGFFLIILSLVLAPSSPGWIAGMLLVFAGTNIFGMGLLGELIVKAAAGGKPAYEITESLDNSRRRVASNGRTGA
ncbi:MAG: glycosyltransferase family 2 protein [Capsulimonadales bacterium]|nr:glycosyltransferase family 2 protein [Capsulimonadales bacterium]